MATKGRSVELYFIDGKPDGMLTAEVFNWIGHVLVAPRIQIGAALSRKEASFTGVYLLVGEQDGKSRAYIGEGEDISNRIRNHDTKKDWWSSAILVTSAANNLNKAHVKYLEARLVEEARSAGRIALENGNSPLRSSISEAAQASMENFLDYLFMVLPALRIDMFLKHTRPAKTEIHAQQIHAQHVFELIKRTHGLKATAALENDEFIVRAGSLARSKWAGQVNHSYSQLYAELAETGVLHLEGDYRVFTENYAFKSPSAAAAVIIGRPSNGTIDWKVQGQNKTYKQWEAEQLAQHDEETV